MMKLSQNKENINVATNDNILSMLAVVGTFSTFGVHKCVYFFLPLSVSFFTPAYLMSHNWLNITQPGARKRAIILFSYN